jgi:hypothetical protein
VAGLAPASEAGATVYTVHVCEGAMPGLAEAWKAGREEDCARFVTAVRCLAWALEEDPLGTGESRGCQTRRVAFWWGPPRCTRSTRGAGWSGCCAPGPPGR